MEPTPLQKLNRLWDSLIPFPLTTRKLKKLEGLRESFSDEEISIAMQEVAEFYFDKFRDESEEEQKKAATRSFDRIRHRLQVSLERRHTPDIDEMLYLAGILKHRFQLTPWQWHNESTKIVNLMKYFRSQGMSMRIISEAVEFIERLDQFEPLLVAAHRELVGGAGLEPANGSVKDC